MKKIIQRFVLTLMTFAMIITLFTPSDAQAATSYKSSDGSTVKCGKYYLKRNSKGIYAKKSKKGKYKKVVSCKSSSDIGYGFVSNGSYIYYADNNLAKERGTIYRIKVNGKSRKKLGSEEEFLNVMYYTGGKLIFKGFPAYEIISDYDEEEYDYDYGFDYDEEEYYILTVSKALKKSSYAWDDAMENPYYISKSCGNKMLFAFGGETDDYDYDLPAFVYDKKKNKIVWKGKGWDMTEDSNFYMDSSSLYYADIVGQKKVSNEEDGECSLVFSVKIKKVNLSTGKKTTMTDVIDVYNLCGVTAESVSYTTFEDWDNIITLDYKK